MERRILADLLAWKSKRGRKPLILTGTRQVGKTYALKAFGKTAYDRVHYLNFEEEPKLGKIFERVLKPERLFQEISFHLDTAIHPLSFEEFLRGVGDEKSLRFLEGYAFDAPIPEMIHDHLWTC